MRDTVLSVSGSLNLKMGGRAVLPPLSAEERLGMWDKDDWPESLDPAPAQPPQRIHLCQAPVSVSDVQDLRCPGSFD